MMSNGQRDGDFEHRDTQQKRKVVCDEERTMKGMKEGQGEGHRIWPEKKKENIPYEQSHNVFNLTAGPAAMGNPLGVMG